MANILEIIVKSKDEASAGLKAIGDKVEGMSKQLKVAGVAMTAIGVAGLKMASDARKMNADLGYTGQIIGATTDEMREMALSITNVTFGIKSVTATFELLARAGVRDQETMKQNAVAFDALADATKSSAEEVADVLIPAYKMFGQELPKTANEMDKWTYLVTTTNVALSDLGSLMGYIATYGRDLNLSAEQVVVMMKAMAEQGRSASDAARLLRTGINEAGGSLDRLYETLGITKEEIAKYTDEMEDATGITDNLARQQEKQYTVLDKLKQKWQELELKLAPVLEVLEPIFSVMTALGPIMISATYIIPKLGTAFAALKAIFVGVKLEAIAMWGAITLGVSLAITGIIELVKHWDALVASFTGFDKAAAKQFEQTMKGLADTLISDLGNAIDEVKDKYTSLIEFLQSGQYEQAEFLTEDQLSLIRQIAPELADQIQAAQTLAKQHGDVADEIERQLEAGKDAIRLAEIQEQLLTATGTEREQLLAEQHRLQQQVYVEQWKDIVRDHQDIIVNALQNQVDSWADYFDTIKAGWDGTLEYLENTIMPAINDAIDKGLIKAEELRTVLEEFAPPEPTREPLWKQILRSIVPGLSIITSVRESQYALDQATYKKWQELIASLGLQSGGIVTKPSLHILGEKGPEAVIPLSETGGLLGQTIENNFYISELVVREQTDIYHIARELYRLQETKRSLRGI